MRRTTTICIQDLRLLTAVRAVWFVLTLITLAVFAVGLPLTFAERVANARAAP